MNSTWSPTDAGDTHCGARPGRSRPARAPRRPRPISRPPSARGLRARPPRAQNRRAHRPSPSRRHQHWSFLLLRPSWCSYRSDSGKRPTSLDATVAGTSSSSPAARYTTSTDTTRIVAIASAPTVMHSPICCQPCTGGCRRCELPTSRSRLGSMTAAPAPAWPVYSPSASSSITVGCSVQCRCPISGPNGDQVRYPARSLRRKLPISSHFPMPRARLELAPPD
jgi:hypothetical protein